MTPAEERRLLAAAAAGIDANLRDAFDEIMAMIDAGTPPAEAIAAVLGNITSDMAAIMAAGLTKVTGEAVTSAEVLRKSVGPMSLSSRLYAESAKVSEVVSGIVTRHVGGFADMRKLALELYEGYGFRQPGDEPLQFNAQNDKLPRYLRDLLKAAPGIQKDIASDIAAIQVRGLSTAGLRAGYSELLKAIANAEKGIGAAVLEKRIEMAFYERMRYFSQRIARTELHRAYMRRNATDMMEDDDIQFVQIRRASSSRQPCICTLYAGRDRYNLGPGVYPKDEAPLPPYHPHCVCIVAPRLDLTDRVRAWPENVEEDVYFLRRLSPSVAARVVGSRDKLDAVLKGQRTADAIQASITPPAYQVPRLGEIVVIRALP